MEMDRFRNEVNMLKGGGEEEEKEELGIQDGHISVEEDYKFSLYRFFCNHSFNSFSYISLISILLSPFPL